MLAALWAAVKSDERIPFESVVVSADVFIADPSAPLPAPRGFCPLCSSAMLLRFDLRLRCRGLSSLCILCISSVPIDGKDPDLVLEVGLLEATRFVDVDIDLVLGTGGEPFRTSSLRVRLLALLELLVSDGFLFLLFNVTISKIKV